MDGTFVIVLSSVFFMGTWVLFMQNRRRIKQRSFGALVMLLYALMFGTGGVAALTISTFDPTSNPTARWWALVAYASCLTMGFGGAWFMLRKR